MAGSAGSAEFIFYKCPPSMFLKSPPQRPKFPA
jgi:hypothetical protein